MAGTTGGSSSGATTAGGPGRVRYLTVAEVAEVMRVSRMTVYRLVHAGELPALRVGRSFRVPQDALTAYLEAAAVDQDRMTS